MLTGCIQKLKTTLSDPVEYQLPIDGVDFPLNACIGKSITLKFLGKIHCLYCNRLIKKSYNQGYCFPCAQTLARCDFCIVKPEKCHFHLGTCREPEWGQTHCFMPHVVYLANTSGVKVGITRETQVPTRWIDQGATQALPILKAKNRYQSGLIEVALKQWINDKTDWRKMLAGIGEPIDLLAKREELLTQLPLGSYEIELFESTSIISIHYPVLKYPNKVQSLNFDKTPEISGTLQGIKGQYLILDIGVINIRNAAGYRISIEWQ